MARRGSYAKGVAKREEILTTALDVIARNGYRRTSVRELADAVGRSMRSVQRSFARDIGMSPRAVLRVARVQRALGLAVAHPEWRWIRIGAHAGYYDQAHLANEFRALCGLTPSAFLERTVSGSSKTAR